MANEGEDLARYEHWLAQFRVQQELDPYYPKHPTVLGRRFDLQRQIPEIEVVALIETLLDSAARNELLDVVEAKLGRPLEAHDVYFEELGDDRPSRELDAIVAEIKTAHEAGQDVARLHSGDLSVWSAMGEQLRRLKDH